MDNTFSQTPPDECRLQASLQALGHALGLPGASPASILEEAVLKLTAK